MSFTDLPTELILEIACNLYPSDITSLSQTVNKQLYNCCMLARTIAQKRNHARMVARFEDYIPYSILCEDEYQQLNLEPKHGPYFLSGLPKLDYLKLNGDLSWLGKNTSWGMDAFDMYLFYDARVCTAKVDALVESAEAAGVVLPEGFVTLIRNPDLQRRMPKSSDGLYFIFRDLQECPSNLDGGAGGYILDFLTDRGNYLYWSLYLDAGKGKGHCVLCRDGKQSPPLMDAYYDDGTCEVEELIQRASTNFEEFLAMMYHHELCIQAIKGHCILPAATEEYIVNVYRRNG